MAEFPKSDGPRTFAPSAIDVSHGMQGLGIKRDARVAVHFLPPGEDLDSEVAFTMTIDAARSLATKLIDHADLMEAAMKHPHG